MQDVRSQLFEHIRGRRYRAVLVAERSGVLSGVEAALEAARELGIELEICKAEGDELSHGGVFANFAGSPEQIAAAEERLMGTMSKASGIATAARTAVQVADGRVKIVSGAWKKMPGQIKQLVRQAIAAGGASFRITEPPMVYMDKNFVRMFGSIRETLAAAACFEDATKCIQLRGEKASIREETLQAVEGGAHILMVDTGRIEDAEECVQYLRANGWRGRVQVAFAGNVDIGCIPELLDRVDVDILDIGKRIVDAPLLDMRLEVIGEEQA